MRGRARSRRPRAWFRRRERSPSASQHMGEQPRPRSTWRRSGGWRRRIGPTAPSSRATTSHPEGETMRTMWEGGERGRRPLLEEGRLLAGLGAKAKKGEPPWCTVVRTDERGVPSAMRRASKTANLCRRDPVLQASSTHRGAAVRPSAPRPRLVSFGSEIPLCTSRSHRAVAHRVVDRIVIQRRDVPSSSSDRSRLRAPPDLLRQQLAPLADRERGQTSPQTSRS